MKNGYLFLKVFMLVLCMGIISSLNAQRLVDLEIKVVEVEHNFQCCTDFIGTGCGGFNITDRPEPRWNFKDTYDDGAGNGPALPGAAYLFNPGNGVDCGTLGVNQLLTDYTGVCAERALIEIESWEDDGGLDTEYDDGLLGLVQDDNYSGVQLFFINFLNNPENVVTNQTITLSNGYNVTISTKWNSYEPAIAPVAAACIGQPATIDVTSSLSSGATDFLLFSDPGLTNLVATGDPLITGPLSAATTFYAVQTNGTCYSDATVVNVPILSTFPAPSVDDTNPLVCAGENITMNVTSAPSIGGNTFDWFDNAALTGAPLTTGTTYTTTGGIASATTYYVAEYNGVCYGTPAVINVDLEAITPPPLASDLQTCINGQVTLVAFTGGANGPFIWYDNAALSNTVSTLTPPLPDSPIGYNYWVTETDPITGCESLPTMITVTTDLIINTPTAVDVTVCEGTSASLSATSNSSTSGSFFWYNNMNASDLAYAGNPFNTPTITTATTYYLVEDINGCLSSPVAVNINVDPKPAPPTAAGATICAGETATLTASGTSGDFFWYSDAAGVTQINAVASSTYTTPALFSNTTYYVAEVNGFGCLSDLTAVPVTVQPLPSAPSSSALNLCEGESGTLTATTGALSGMITWYDDLGTQLQQDNVLPATSEYTVTTPSVGTTLYYVSFTAANGCESEWTTVAVNVATKPAAPTGIADVAVCEGSSATIVAGSGTFNWYLNMTDTSPYSTGQAFTTPTAVTTTTSYYVTQVVAGCESDKDEVVVMVQMNLVAPNISSNAPVCQGADLILSVDDPINPAYTYTWTDPNGTTLANSTFTTTSASLNSGTYILTIEDANGCSATSTILVEVLTAPQSAPLFSNSAVCEGGTIELSTSVVAGATYTWTGPGVTGGTEQTANATYSIPNALLAHSGTYEVIVSTGSGCDPQASTTTVQVDPIPATPTTTDITVCEGDNVVLSATGSGAGTLNYTLGGSSVSPVVGTGLAPGVYSYEVTESIGDCESMPATITVTVNAQPDAPITTDITVCEGESVILSASSSNTITWSDGPDLGTSLAAGTYTYYASASDGNCTSELSPLVVTVNASLLTAPTTTDITACEGENIVLSATGSGVGTLVYELAGSSVSPIVGTGLAPGVYSYTVTEVAGDCVSPAATITVTINAQPAAPITTDIDVCEGESVILSAVSSNTITWSDGPDLGTTLTAGTYVYYATASDGTCTSEASALVVTVGNNSYPTPTVANIVVCEGEPVSLVATGSGAGSISFYDATGALVSPNLGTSLAAGTYTYTATEGDGNCESVVPASITVTVEANPSIGTITNNSPLCEGETIEIDAPTIANVDYAWTGPNGNNLGTSEDLTITNAIKGNHQGLYTLVVTDQTTGCESAPMSTYVEVNTTPDGLVVSNSGVTCVGGTVSLTATGFFGATYEWSDPSGTVIATTQNHVLDNVTLSDGGTYNLTVNLGNCASATLETVVSVNEGANVSAGLDVEVFQGESVQLLGTGALSYSWSSTDYLSNPSAADPIFSNAPLGVYNYTLTGYGANSCSGTDDVTITVVPNTELEIVDLFTPNGDGVNDTWKITYLENLKDGYTLRIYARGGIQIMETSNYNNDWDGTLEGKNLPDGTYWYVIAAGDGTEYKGAVTLKR